MIKIVKVFIWIGCFFVTAAAATPIFEGCSPGHEVVRNVTTYCSKCKDSYYSKDGVKCLRCSTCSKGQKEMSPCSPDKDRYCECQPNKYLDTDILMCSTCHVCQIGFYQTRDCKFNKDRSCEPCKRGHTTNNTNAKVCVVITSTTPTKINRRKNRGNPALVIAAVCTIIFVALIFTAGIVIFCCYRRRKKLQKGQPERVRTLIDTDNDVYVELDDSVHEHRRVSTTNKNLRSISELRPDIINQLSYQLNPVSPNSWVQLAVEINLKPEYIKNLALCPTTATHNVIAYYATTKDSTIAAVYNALLKIERPNLAKLLRPHLYTTVRNSSVTDV